MFKIKFSKKVFLVVGLVILSAGCVFTAIQLTNEIAPNPEHFIGERGCCDGINIVYDIDGNEYNTVAIGSQCWMKENLKVEHKPTGEEITRYCYNDDETICDETDEGGLYTWGVAMDGSTTEKAQGICPDGWHIPSDGEFSTLENYLGGMPVAGDKMKLPEDCYGGVDCGISGFCSLLTGFRYTSGDYYDRGMYAHFWSSTQSRYSMGSDYSEVYLRPRSKTHGFSVRCLKD